MRPLVNLLGPRPMQRLVKRTAALLAALAAPLAMAAQLSVLSAGAVEPALVPALAAFERASGHGVSLAFATAPRIRERILAGEVFDVVIAPPAVLDDLALAGKVSGARVSLGRVGIGVAVRADAPVPEIGDAQSFKRALLDADSLVYNRASTGLYFEGLLVRLGIDTQLQAKTTRHADGASVVEHVRTGRGREIGIGAITEIMLFRDKGVRLVGPLPAELQNYTTYVAIAMPRPDAPADHAQALLAHLRAGSAAFAAAGIEP